MSGSAKATKHIDNDKVVVTEWRMRRGDSTGWHRHTRDYVVVPLTDGRIRLATTHGESMADVKRGAPYFRSAGVEHDVINAGDGEYAFIEIEIK